MKKFTTIFLLTFVLVISTRAEEDLVSSSNATDSMDSSKFIDFIDSSNSTAKKWESFFGLSVGVGTFGASSTQTILGLSLNESWEEKSPLGLSYAGEILGGWQKYTSEKIGVRHTLGFSFAYAPNMTSIRTGKLSYSNCLISICDNSTSTKDFDPSNRYALQYGIDYSFDALFDLIQNEKTRFGITLGFAFEVKGIVWESFENERRFFVGMRVGFGVQSGFYIRSGNNGLDLICRLPLVGYAGSFGPTISHNSLLLGYKYFF